MKGLTFFLNTSSCVKVLTVLFHDLLPVKENGTLFISYIIPKHLQCSIVYSLYFFTSFLWTDDLLCTIDFKYSRKKKQSVREHLKSLQKPPCNVIRGGDDTIDEVSDMYEHARFETKVNFIIHE